MEREFPYPDAAQLARPRPSTGVIHAWPGGESPSPDAMMPKMLTQRLVLPRAEAEVVLAQMGVDSPPRRGLPPYESGYY